MVSNWCDVCQEACNDHPTMCSICGTPLTERTEAASAPAAAPSEMGREDQLLRDMRQASQDLRNILGNLRGEVHDLENLTRNIVEAGHEVPPELLDPQSGGNRARPTSEEALKKMARFVLHEHSTLFRQATLRVNTESTIGVSSTAAAGCGGESQHQAQQILPTSSLEIPPSTSDISSMKHAKRIDCTLGEFGSAEEFMFEMGTCLVMASPITGKGGLDRGTIARIQNLKSKANNVVLLMKRGAGLTFVQKARMAQEAGASAVIIANNMANPWPYVMKDSKGESKKAGHTLSIPVAMIKEEDGKEIIQIFEAKKELARKRKASEPPIPTQIVLGKEQPTPTSSTSSEAPSKTTFHDMYSLDETDLTCELVITAQSSDCPVCCEEMKHEETVIQLPGCGHFFHEDCAMKWLQSHNTCPYCRRELPTDDPEYEETRRRRQQQQQEQAEGTTGAGAFYG